MATDSEIFCAMSANVHDQFHGTETAKLVGMISLVMFRAPALETYWGAAVGVE